MKQNANVQSWRRLSLLLLAVTGVWLASATQAFAAEGSGSCTADSEVRQLDYWLGHWTMKSDGGSSTSSKVTLSLDKCMFIEHWENGKGHVTEKMFAYSPEDKNWGGMFADNEGRMHVSFLPAKFHRHSRVSWAESPLSTDFSQVSSSRSGAMRTTLSLCRTVSPLGPRLGR